MTKKSTPPSSLLPENLTWRSDPSLFARLRAEGTDPPLIGQPRAVEAIRLGLAMDAPGYNIFACGPSGTGKMSTVRGLLREGVRARQPLRDLAYVQNFSDTDRPNLLQFPAGRARRFKRAFEAFVKRLPELVRAVVDSEKVETQRRDKIRHVEGLEERLIESFEARCETLRFALVQVQVGNSHHIDVLPIYKRKPIEIDELNEIAAEGGRVPKLAETNRVHGELKDDLRKILTKLRRAGREAHEAVEDMEQAAVSAALEAPLTDLAETFPFGEVPDWLSRAGEWVAEHLELFREDDDDDPRGDQPMRQLRVNIVLDNHGQDTPPIVIENFPTFTNLLGTLEHPSDEIRPTVDFTDIRAGSLLRADGGYLVINANDTVQESGVWRALSRVMKTRELEILSPEQYFSPGGGSALKPEPIPVDVKVIAIGDDGLYRALHDSSDDFRRVFKLKADFDDIMPRSERTLAIYARHAWRVVREEDLPKLEDDALARIAEHGVRLSGRKAWLSTRFSDITDLLREAGHYAKQDKTSIQLAHVNRALTAHRHRHALIEERLRYAMKEGILDIDTSGHAVGCANALTVVDLGDHVFGQPCRISATCAPGTKGVLSVEREVRLSGRLHDKGTMLLTAYLRTHYLPTDVLALSATVTFEQLHEEVDGDSASTAETVALLSSLANVPVRQSLAMTGAIDQSGRVQAVGGLNEKVEGFFRLCAERGLTGEQGIALPYDNRDDLVLSSEVVDAVRAGKFHIWAVSHIDEVLALATGLEVGVRGTSGNFTPNSFNELVERRLKVLTSIAASRRGL